jgi:hypothetical protein
MGELIRSYRASAASANRAAGHPGPACEVLLPAQISFRHLRTPSEISEIIPLRAQIELPAAAAADPDFGTREKKEMSWGWWAPSCTTARP